MSSPTRRTVTGAAVLIVTVAVISVAALLAQTKGGVVTGELKRWHKVVVTLDGPAASATGTPNPFLDLRVDVTFTHAASGTIYRVPGFFDADGNAANTSAASGNKWRAILTPDKVGQWTYRVSFRRGPAIAVADSVSAGEALAPYDGQTGKFSIAETDKTGRALQSGSVTTLAGGGKDWVEVGQPPTDPERDWVVLIRPEKSEARATAR